MRIALCPRPGGHGSADRDSHTLRPDRTDRFDQADRLDRLDRLGQPLFVHDAGGRPLHTTPSAHERLADDPEAERVRRAARRLAHVLATQRTRSRTGECTVPVQLVDELDTMRAHYELHASFVAPPLAGPDLAIVVTLTRSAGNMLGDDALRVRYRLTTREIQVARLLACRHSAIEIADTLGVSVHTARRHTERVLMKLGIHARGQVAARLRAGG